MIEATNPFDARSPQERLEITRRKRLILANLNGAIYALIPFGIYVAYIFLPLRSLYANIVFWLSIGTLPITLLARYIVRKDRLTPGSLMFLIYAIGAISINSLILDGLIPVLAPTLILLTIIGGMMLKTFEGYIVGIVSALVYILVRVLTVNNQFPLQLPFSSSLAMELFLTSLAFVFIAYFNRLSTRDLRRSLDEATYDLIRLNKEVQEASDRKSQFTARTSHELRTPLSAIIVFADLTLREAYGPLSEKMRNAQQHIVNSARHLKRIIDDLLDLSKIEAGEFEITREPFVIEEIVSVIESSCMPIAREKGVDFSIAVDKALPPTLMGDCERVSQIAVNLAGNAVKFTGEGQVLIRIEPVDEATWHIVVSDTGPGIPEDQHEKVFEAFRSLDKSGTKSVAASTGLGLAIARNLAQLMGGTIQLESELGVGSTFEVRLPMEAAELVEEIAQPA
jgi:signal transduction histidine kinase